MSAAQTLRVPPRARGVRSWPIWELPRWLVGYVGAMAMTWVAAAIVSTGQLTAVRPAQLALLGLLLAGSTATVELTRRAGENAGVVKDVYAIWELPVAILAPPFYALLAPIPRIALTQWRIRQIPLHRRVLTAAAIGLSYGAASVAFHAVMGSAGLLHAGGTAETARWIVMVAGCGLLQWAVNQALVLPAVKGSDPTASIGRLILNPENLQNDLTEVSAAVLAAIGAAASPVSVILELPLVIALQRSFRHAQLVNDSRIDSKTGLLNAGTWQREANGEVMRAHRTGSPLAVALIDIDDFKAVNDTYGHLTGDRALGVVTGALTMLLRDYDLAGRFGGDELALLLPHTGQHEAAGILERIRSHIAATPIEANSQEFRCTISAGVAALGTGPASLTELLAAADSALYQAKQAGRDRIWVLSQTESFTPTGEPGAGRPAMA